MSVFVTGDCHGDISRFSTHNFSIQKELTKDDYVICLGDFGLIWDYKGENNNEKYWLDWLENKPFTTLFIDGNHECHDRLDAYPIEYWHGGKVHKIRPSVIHLMRGQCFEICNKVFFTFGGAKSPDISDGILEMNDPEFNKKRSLLDKKPFSMYRINHVDWWEREMPSEQEMQDGILNLKKRDNKVDYILTHCPFTSLLPQMDRGRKLYKSDYLTDYFQLIK